ncbi:MAG TPA: hypothetical protein VNZ86_14510, partial [Bacteroidia bacterium]|nr:hypothetical protein [Bacteroidia bacterium]
YALDDQVVLTGNRFVQEGVRGIPSILWSDYVAGYSARENILSGSRYRPLSLVLFAVEYQFFGAKPWVSHGINLILFALLLVALFRFLSRGVFRSAHPYLALLTCLLFAAHPIHTEVTANVKSRDELITFSLLIVSAHSFLNFAETKKQTALGLSLLCYFLALLSKETAITFLGIYPLLIFFFLAQPLRASMMKAIPFAAVTVIYLLIRWRVVGFSHYLVTDIANSPYLYATDPEAFATKVYVLFRYMALLVFPWVLSTDYGYNQIPYVTLTSPAFLLSVLLVTSLLVWACMRFFKRDVYAFSILYFFITLSVGSNFLFDLGAPLAERMLFTPSLAFCIILAKGLLERWKGARFVASMTIGLILILFSVRTIIRNGDWKNNETLFLSDVQNCPHSARLNLYACEVMMLKAANEKDTLLTKRDLDRAVVYGVRSVLLHHRFAYSWLRLGIVRELQHRYVQAGNFYCQALKQEPGDANTRMWMERLCKELEEEAGRLNETGFKAEAGSYMRQEAVFKRLICIKHE